MELFIVTIMVCLAVSFALTMFSERLGIPSVIGQILAGIILGIPFLKNFIIGENGSAAISLFSEFGVIFLLLLAGMQTDLRKIKHSKKDILIISFFSAVIPFLVGFLIMRYMGYSTLVSLVVGAALSVTSEGTNLKVLLDLKVLKTRLGNIIMGAGIADDIFEILALGFILVIAENEYGTLIGFPFKILGFVALTYLIVKAIPKLANIIRYERTEVGEFSLLMVITLFIASSSVLFGLGPIIGAFIAGIIIQYSMNKREEHKMINDLKILSFGFIVPFFFINIGINFDFSSIAKNFLLFLIILFVATATKLVGAILASFFTDITFRQSLIVGWGMNARGAVELIIAGIALQNSLITPEIYSVIVAVAIITTIIFPFMLKYYLKKYPKIMN